MDSFVRNLQEIGELENEAALWVPRFEEVSCDRQRTNEK